MIVVIDSGNTSAKIGVFEDGDLRKVIKLEDYGELVEQTKALNPEKILICSVKFPVEKIKNDLKDYPSFVLSDKTPVPFKMKYRSPATLGVDRIALAAGGYEKYQNNNILVIGTGTCVTYDFINNRGEYMGGGISPGLDMRFKCLHQFTENLPLINFRGNPDLIGDTTENSILSGVIHGIIAEINGIISAYRQRYGQLYVILSGGNVKFFESTLKDSIFAIPDLVILGTYSIFSFNER